ncbi:uncharacterized protein LOC107271722 isoform X2 [Cephus cinctus]|uniref:Uncharacterized protein LOC107271722 isoform X2 n=1 Tax=Cephus cinctus TaxID=211228 RepID=A0AAJ7C7V6_CEPCN|nr:uncharacterized protein LOC107271722 isoform X2 [Cephus cinctus]
MLVLQRMILLVLLVARYSSCSFVPPSLGGVASSESGLSLSDITQRKSGAEYVALGNGRTGSEGAHGYDKGEEAAHGVKQNDARYDERDNSQRGYDVGKQSLGQAQSFDQGNNQFEQHGAGQYKKGFHKSGFRNNYHKDESGDKASFYEDSDDEKGHRGFDNRGGHYGRRAQDGFRDGRFDNAFTGRNRAQQGLYDNGAGYNNRRGHNGGYDDNRYYDDRRNYLHDGAGRVYDRNGNEAYYRRDERPYHHPLNYGSAPLVSGPLYSRDYLDAPPARYFPERRDYHRAEIYYPDKGGYGHGDYYAVGYKRPYGRALDIHPGYRRPY